MTDAIFDEIVTLLSHTSLMETPASRTTLLRTVFIGLDCMPDVDCTGAPREVSQRIVQCCYKYGPLPTGKLALVRLLEQLRAETGEQARLNQLIQLVSQPELQATSGNPITRYRQELIEQLSQPRYQIDKRFVRLTLLTDLSSEGIRSVATTIQHEYADLRSILADAPYPALVLLGTPGSGKTTLLRRLQLDDARDQLPHSNRTVSFFLSLNRYPLDNPPAPSEWLTGEWHAAQPDLPTFMDLVKDGKMLLLLDALNGMRHRDRDDFLTRIDSWRDFIVPFVTRGNHIVFSCRSLDYCMPLSSPEVMVSQVAVNPMTPRQIEEFLNVYIPSHAEAIWDSLKSDPEQLHLFSTPYFLRLAIDQFGPESIISKNRTALFTSFVRHSLEREVGARNHLLTTEGLLDDRDRRQIAVKAYAQPHSLPEHGCLIPKLSELAYRMQQNGTNGDATQIRVSETIACALLDHSRAQDILNASTQINVLDEDLKHDEVMFFHQLLQEYFAARHMACQPDVSLAKTEWRADQIQPNLSVILAKLHEATPLPPAPTTSWEETVWLATEMVPNPESFIRDISNVNLPLAGFCAVMLGTKVSLDLKEHLQHLLLLRSQERDADIRARIYAADILGWLGDPRFKLLEGQYGKYSLPPFINIPGGTYCIGDDNSEDVKEKPAHTINLPSFNIGKFPVTNAEYSLFIQAGGYERERWWVSDAARKWLSGEGVALSQRRKITYIRSLMKQRMRTHRDEDSKRMTPVHWHQNLAMVDQSDQDFEKWLDDTFPLDRKIREPLLWNDPSFSSPAQPVVGICWYEARAYCAWLSAQNGMVIRLPTEVEWEAAARGRLARKYPYGDLFNPSGCNTYESHIRRTTPIGVFLDGQTEEGVSDLCGNVWDWTNSAYLSYPYEHSLEREAPGTSNMWRVWRGGSWDLAKENVKPTRRYASDPGERNSALGFRVACFDVPIKPPDAT